MLAQPGLDAAVVEVLALANGDELGDVGGHGADRTTHSRAHRAALLLAALVLAACVAQPYERTAPADLTRIAARNGGRFDAHSVAAYIDGRNRVGAHGSSEMPVWGRPLPDRFGRPETYEPLLTPDVIRLLTEYLRSIQSEKTA